MLFILYIHLLKGILVTLSFVLQKKLHSLKVLVDSYFIIYITFLSASFTNYKVYYLRFYTAFESNESVYRWTVWI